jgi:ribosomal protein S18 acetylase RimI-like enzyme
MAADGDGRLHVRETAPILSTVLRSSDFAEVRKHAPLIAQDRLIISEGTAMHWYAETAGAGFVGINTGPRRVDVKVVWVFPEDRGSGVGKRMMAELIRIFGDRAFRLVADESLFGFYEPFGFQRGSKYKRGGTSWHMDRPAP